MSWDATLKTERGYVAIDVNYTHNVNKMIALAIERSGMGQTEQCTGSIGFLIGPAWWKHLDGMTGLEGAVFLTSIVDEMVAHPEVYEPLNPKNGWGNYDDLVEVLRSMRDATEERAVWDVSG